MPRPSSLPPQQDQRFLTGILRGALSARDGIGDAQWAVNFFCTRQAGFLAPEEAKRAAAVYARDQRSWQRELRAETQSHCEEGLPVYALRAGALEEGLNWPSLPSGPQGDRLYRLRPHRFGFLPRLALASCLGVPALSAVHNTLTGWLGWARTPEGRQDAYFSNLVVIYRLLAVSWAAPFFAAMAEEGDETAADVCLQLFRVVSADCAHLIPLIGRSAPNNHLLADCFAAWFLAVCYPELVAPDERTEEHERAWQVELGRQFQDDGTSFEQSLHYHELGCEMAAAYLVISLRLGRSPAAPILARIAAMLRFQAALADREGRGFALGDATDDPLLPLDAGSGSAPGAWRILYRALFDPAFSSTAATAAGAERAYWLLAALGNTGPLPLPGALQPPGQFAAFPEGGYFCFREEASEDYLLFRSGPAPSSSVFPGHAMSDFLSVYWNRGGKAVLAPAGTYTYAAGGPSPDGQPRSPRAYFRGPAAHNGPVLRGHDPLGIPRGRFRNYDNGARAASQWLHMDDVLAWSEARLEGPGRLDGWRRGVVRVPGWSTLVYDRLPALPDEDGLACHWQFSAEAMVSLPAEGQAIVTLDGLSAYLCASRGVARIELAEGRQEPAAGWVAPRYGELQPAPQLICRVRPGTGGLAFALGTATGDPLPDVEVETVSPDGIVISVRQGTTGASCIVSGKPLSFQSRGLDIDFDGAVLWLVLDGDRCRELRTLGMRRLQSRSLGLALTAEDDSQGGPGWRCLAATSVAGRLSGRWEAAFE